MAKPNREFGNLLTQGLKSIGAREHKAILALEDELGYEIEGSRWGIEKWRQGSVPSDSKKVAFLARTCVRRGGMDKQWLSRFLTQARFPNKEALLQELFPGENQTSSLVHHNLPGRPYERFVGREREFAELQRFLSPRHRLGVICLSSIAGVGKTALALEVAHSFFEHYTTLPSDERFEAMVWITAKQTELLPAGLVIRRPTFTDLDGLYRALAEVLDLPAITRAVTVEDRDVIVAHALAEHKVLLVLDNLEDVDDPALMVFLRDLPTPCKAIVTTRQRIDVAVSIQLHPFNELEARELIRFECQRHHLSLTHEQTEKLLRHTGCLALAIVRTIARMAWRGSSIEAELRQLGDPTNVMHSFCFDKSIALIRGGDAHQLLMALVLFATDATREALGYVAGFKEDILDRDEGLSELEVLSLVNKESDRFGLESLTKVKAQEELAAHPGFKREAYGRWIEWYKRLAEQAEHATNYAHLQAEISNLMSVINWLIEQGQMDDVGWFFRRTRKFLYAEGQWEFLLRLAEQVTIWAESAGDAEMLANTLNAIVPVLRRQANPVQGKGWLERTQISATRLRNELLQAEVWLAQGEILYYQASSEEEDINPVITSVTQALEIFRRYDKTERILESLNTLGNAYLKQRHFEEAMRFYQEGLRVLEDSGSKTQGVLYWYVILRGNSGIVVGRQGHYAEACEILYEILKDLTDQTDFAEAYAILALYEHHLGNTSQAYLFRRHADTIIKQLSLIRPICVEDAEWMQLNLDQRNRPLK